MSRSRKFAKSLVSGYAQMGANIVFTLVSVPLAWHYLHKDQFGLWAVTTQIVSYIALLDFGLSGAAMRILIDYKDDPTDPRYGGVILTGLWVNAAHALLILLGGWAVTEFLPGLFNVPQPMEGTFRWLMLWQSASMALSAGYRTPVMILTAHQRYDVVNSSQALLFLLNLAVVWLGFRWGQGLASLVWGQVVAQVLGCVVAAWGCWRLKLLPRRGCWGRATWDRFWELFGYGRDMFLFLLGSLFISASQTILVTRVLGLEAAAVWSVCTRVFVLLTQSLNRLFDFSSPAFAEMIVRGEQARLFTRFRSLMVITASVGAVAAIGMAAINRPFVRVWTHGRINGPPILLPGEFKDLTNLTSRLVSRTDPVSAFLWDQMGSDLRQSLTAPTSSEKDSGLLRTNLAAGLNAVLRGPSWYEESRFAQVRLSEATKAMLSEPVAPEGVLRLNRLLLEDAYPEVLARNRVIWPVTNDLLLGIWLVFLVLVRNHAGLVGMLKDFRFLRYLFLIEGAVGVCLGYLALQWGGIPWMLAASLAATLCISLPYGVSRTSRFFGLRRREVALGWMWPAMKLVLFVGLPVALVCWAVRGQSDWVRFTVGAVVTAGCSGPLLLRFGLDEAAHAEFLRRLPLQQPWLRRLLTRRIRPAL